MKPVTCQGSLTNTRPHDNLGLCLVLFDFLKNNGLDMKNQTLISLTPWPPFWSKKFSVHFKNLTIYHHFLVLNKWYICNKTIQTFPNVGDTHSYVLWASLTWLYPCRNAKYPFIQTSTMLEPLHRMNEGHTNRSVKIERCEWVLSENRLCPKCQAMEISWFSHTHNNVVHD